mmetsp:Transcript_9607/g.9269  ORF Transcript_9607/g.9269 Transcript_9607/m.9269 type:complete len:108 (+) Transcript_9607:1620-1943(+)
MALLLGYYADMLFKKNNSKFVTIMNFLIQGLQLKGDEKVIALQCADTLNTIITDTDLVPRLSPMLPTLLPLINQCVLTIQIQVYFTFMVQFITNYAEKLDQDVILIV